jgi:hypothetical protein
MISVGAALLAGRAHLRRTGGGRGELANQACSLGEGFVSAAWRSVARPHKTLGLPFPRSIFFSFASAYDELSEECDLRPAGSRIQSHFCTGTWMHLLLLLMN